MPTVKKISKIVLTDSEQQLVKHIAAQRFSSNRQVGVGNKKMGNQSDDFTDLNGFGGEIAFCKAMNLYPDLNIVPGGGDDLADAVLPDGRTVDVKTSVHPKANLIARKIQDGIDIFVLMKGSLPEYEIIGYAERQALVDAPTRDLGYGPTHFLDAKDLKPISELVRDEEMSYEERQAILDSIDWESEL